MAVSGLGSRKALVGTRRAISILFGVNGLRNELSRSPLVWSIQGPFCQLARLTSSRALVESLLSGGCDYSHVSA